MNIVWAICLVFRCWHTLPRALWNAEMALCKEAAGHICWPKPRWWLCGGDLKRRKQVRKKGHRWKRESRHYQRLGTWSLVPKFLSTEPREELRALVLQSRHSYSGAEPEPMPGSHHHSSHSDPRWRETSAKEGPAFRSTEEDPTEGGEAGNCRRKPAAFSRHAA